MMKQKNCKDSGFTLIELLVVFIIVLVAIVALYVGIQFAEKQVTRNYHSRRALLIASGTLDYQFYLKKKKLGYFDLSQTGGLGGALIDGPSLYPSNDSRNLQGSITATIKSDELTSLSSFEIDGTDRLKKTVITVVVEWKEPASENKTKFVKMVEDYYEVPF